ncbi:FAD:protein FMN transferase [Georgenia thermotolerans]|uniref:FAD:protein FMN transferase n=1 Tax=Georgenia thermotolerans TaxID=527326 RepID=A0A7J5US55_9MICO|nr:FAD:protein FMN transferase [Georgenia thermotolerans]KAE8765148.1 FAD:protein FMN transferase [Georgenia thermotolerans]
MRPAPVGLDRRAWHETVMGMPVSVHLRGPGLGPAADVAVAAVYTELRRLETLLSTYRPDSDVSRLADGVLTLDRCAPEVAEVLELCALATTHTAGAFTALRPLPGGGHRIDPTGLVKGWAVERAAAPLRDLDADWYVNAGGDIAAHVAEDRPAWRVGVEDPRDRGRVLAVVALRDGGVATSGTAARGAHIWDPRTGAAADDLASVTVAGPTLLWADVFATAVFVEGPTAAAWAARDGYEVVVVHHDGRAERTLPLVAAAPAAPGPTA